MTGMIDRLASSETLARASVNLNAGALDKQDEMLARVTPEQRAEMVLGPGALRFAQDAEMANAIAANPKDFETLGLLEGTVAAWKAGRHDLEVSTAASGLVRAQQTLDNPQAAVERLRDSISEEDQAIAERLTGVNPVNAYAAIADKESAAYRMMVDRREEQLHKLIDASSRIEEYTRPKIMEKISAAEGFWGSFQAFLEDPINAMLYTGVSSMASQAEWLAASIPAYALGGRLTGAATAGLGSYTVDYGASLVQAMTEAGVDMGDEASVRAWLENPDNVGRAVTEATLHAQGVSAFDFLAGLVAPMNLRMFSGTFGLGRQLARSARRLNAAGLKPTAIARGVRSTLLRQSPYGKMLDQLFSQAVAGAALGMAGEYTGQRMAGQSINWGDILLEGIGEFFTMPVEAASAHAGLAMRNYKELKHAQFAARAQEMFPKVVEGMRLTNLRKANPGVFKQLAREMGAAHGVKEFYISSQDLTSTEGLADAIVQAAPELAEQVRAAVTQGSDVAIPIETLAGPMADNAELINQMKPLVRITPDGMSAREADEFVNSPEIKKFGQAYVEEVIAQRQKDTAFNQELDEVFAPIKEQFLAARSEQITPEVVDKSIAATRMILGSFATRMGLTPKQFAERFPLMVQRVVDSSRAEMMRRPQTLNQVNGIAEEPVLESIVVARGEDGTEHRVLGIDGNPDLMVMPAGIPGIKPLPVRLQVGTYEGEHIRKHEAELKAAGYASVLQAIYDIVQNYRWITEGAKTGSLRMHRPLYVTEKGHVKRGVLQIELQEIAGAYRIGSVYVSAKPIKEKVLLDRQARDHGPLSLAQGQPQGWRPPTPSFGSEDFSLNSIGETVEGVKADGEGNVFNQGQIGQSPRLSNLRESPATYHLALLWERAAWQKTVDDIINGKVPAPRPNESVPFLSRLPVVMDFLPAVQKAHGNLPIELRAMGHVFDGVLHRGEGKNSIGQNVHDEVDRQVLLRLPNEIADPIAIFESATRPNSYVFMITPDPGRPTIVVPVEIAVREDFKVVNVLKTAVPKTDQYGKPNNEWFGEQIKAGRAVYVNRKKLSGWNTSARSNSVSVLSPRSLESVPGEEDLRNLRESFGNKLFQSAWHGSPYNFNRFTLDHIGTGEGAQAHGWGLYFALEKAVGRKYRERLKRPLQEYMSAGAHAVNELWERYFSAVVRGKPLNSRAKTDDYGKGAVELLHGVVADFNAAEMFDTATRTRLIEEYIADVQDDVRYGNVDQATADEFRDVAREWLEAVKDLPPHEGALYEVEIPEDDVMLREDALLKDQPPKVRDACRRLIEDLLEQNPEYEDDVGDIDHLMETVTAKTFYDNTQVMLAGFEVDSPQGEMMMARPGDEAKAMSQLLNSYGVKGMRYYSATDGECAVVWDEDAISIRTTLEQGMADEVRGQFDTATGMMTLFEKADESTFLHETGHYFLNAMSEMGMEILNRPAEERTAGESEMVSMLGGFLQWCGIEGATDEERIRNFAAMGQAGDTRFRDAHEKFSRGYEAYVREGNAPVPALRRIFKRFKEWLMRLYRSAEELDVELSPEVRALYSRMFTSEAEARQLAEEADLRNMFGPKKPAAISDEEWQELNDLYDEAREAAVASVRANRERNFRILTDKYEREKRGVQKEYEAIEKNVREEVENSPVYQADKALTGGLTLADGTRAQFKLHRAALEELGLKPDVIQALVDKGYVIGLAMVNGEGQYDAANADAATITPQLLSDLVGGGDTLQFMTQLAQAEPLDAAVTAAAQERFLEQYGDFPDEDGVNSAARNQVALHSDAYGKALEREYNLLSRLAKGPKALARLAREVVSKLAHQQVGNLKVRDLKPVINSRAEARAGREARKALARGDIAAAMDAKRKQMMQHFLAKAGQEARVEIAKAITRVRKTLRSKTIHGAHMAQLENLAAVFGLADREFNTQTPPLRAFVEEAATEQGFFFEFDDVVFAEGDVPYQALTIEQFRAVMEAFDQIAHTGRERQSVTINGQKVRTADAVKAARESIEQHAAEKGREFKVEWSGEKPPRFAGLFRFMRNHVKVSSWTRIMDGAQDGGIMWQLFTRRANQCGDKETELRARLTRHLMEVLEPLYKGPKLDEAVASISVTLTDKAGRQTTAPRSITRLERFVMALNWGNDGNRQRLRDGFGLTDETVGEILAGMTEAEWRCVEGVWKTFESLRPEMEALETRIYGRPPQWIEYSPFRVKAAGGREIEVSGGYYPAMYDLSVDSLANERDAAKEAERMMQNAFTAVRTDRSHMKKRAARNYQPMDLRLSSMFDAINSEVHDLCWREFVIDSERLLRGGLKDTIRGFYSNDVQRIFQNWVKDLALGDKRARGLEGEEWASRLRQGVGLAGLGFNIVSALAQTTGILATASRLGTATLRGVSMYARNPIAATREACEESTFMRNRSITRFRELNEVANRIRGKSEIIEGAQKYGYWLLLKVQQVVDVTTWHGAYAKAIGEGRSHEDAVALADQCVIDTQGGGELKDLSQIERGGYMAKLFTVFYAFMNTAFNLNAVSILGEKSKAKAAAQILTLSVVMPVLEQIIRAAMPAGDAGYGDADDKDDEQTRYYKRLRRAVGDIVEFNLGTIVGAREVSTSLGNVIAGEMAWDWRGPSGARVLYDTNALIKRLPKIATGEFDVATIKAISNWMGATMGLPSAQLNRLLATYQGVQKGKLDGPADIARGAVFGVRLQK